MDKVIIRQDTQGPFALFPEYPVDHDGHLCQVYRDGHLTSSSEDLLRHSKHSDAGQELDLLRELIEAGYDPWVVKRETPAMRAMRRAIAQCDIEIVFDYETVNRPF